MNDPSQEINRLTSRSPSAGEALRLLDLATEVLEGLDELGINSRAEVVALMDKLERLIDDEA